MRDDSGGWRVGAVVAALAVGTGGPADAERRGSVARHTRHVLAFARPVRGGTAPLYFENRYQGPPLSSRVGISYDVLGGDTSGAVFAVDGPGLPVLQGANPSAGVFAEIDFQQYGEAVCPPKEPAGVRCEEGLIVDLQPNANYTVVQIAAPAGCSVATPQKFSTDSFGGTQTVYFRNVRN